jgi:hypothetical protein
MAPRLFQLPRVAFPLALCCLPFLASPPLFGDQGDPLAIRTWPSGVVSLETHWDLEVVISLKPGAVLPESLAQADLLITRLPEKLNEFRCELLTQAARPALETSQPPSEAAVAPSVSHWPLSEFSLYLDRIENEARPTLLAAEEATFVSKNALSISHIEDRLLLISVDGVRLALPLIEQFANLESQVPVDVLIMSPLLPVADDIQEAQLKEAQLVAQALLLEPRTIVVSSPLSPSSVTVPELANGNTLAVRHVPDAPESETEQQSRPAPNWLHLRTEAWEMPQAVAELFQRKEQACLQSQQTFAPLSVAQLNFKPSNGTHTARWNCEHMMGRELLFFSQIFAQQSSVIEVIDLNPKQMPPEYEPRKAEWDGGEEARQMERVSRFSRRFAYLLDGLELDQPAPGSSWTLRKLLVQMDKHYTEHTANVVKKFALTDWPRE